MKRNLRLIVPALLICLALTACGRASATVTALDSIKQNGKIPIGIDDAFPPMEFRDSAGMLVGFEKDIMDEIAERMGVTVEYVPTEWSGITGALLSGRFDMIFSAMTITPEREQSVAFSEPYMMGAQVIAVRANSGISSMEQLAGKTVASQLGSSGVEAAITIPSVTVDNLRQYNAFTEAFQDLAIGRVDAVVVDEVVASYYLTKEPGAFEVLPEPLTSEPLGIAFRPEDKTLRDAVQTRLNAIKADGTWDRISLKWFGKVVGR